MTGRTWLSFVQYPVVKVVLPGVFVWMYAPAACSQGEHKRGSKHAKGHVLQYPVVKNPGMLVKVYFPGPHSRIALVSAGIKQPQAV